MLISKVKTMNCLRHDANLRCHEAVFKAKASYLLWLWEWRGRLSDEGLSLALPGAGRRRGCSPWWRTSSCRPGGPPWCCRRWWWAQTGCWCCLQTPAAWKGVNDSDWLAVSWRRSESSAMKVQIEVSSHFWRQDRDIETPSLLRIHYFFFYNRVILWYYCSKNCNFIKYWFYSFFEIHLQISIKLKTTADW